MKKSILLIALALMSLMAPAQTELVVKKSAKGLYITHTVAPKETFYSVGRLYNVPAKEIAAFNGLDMSHGLLIGKTIHIPLTAQNFSQEKNTAKPVYYVVGQKEGLYRVSANNNNVLMARLREWNQLSSDNINPGQKLIVGFLISPGVQQPTAATVQKQEIKSAEPPKAAEPVKTEVVVEKQEWVETPAKVEEKPLPKKSDTRPLLTSGRESGSGFFKNEYELQLKVQPASKDETITAGIFKTASGWQDGKFYALMDDVEPGTIIKIINPNNNKAVYAKVLDKMSGIRQNSGYDLRMSNAAAVALDISDTDKFFVRVIY